MLFGLFSPFQFYLKGEYVSVSISVVTTVGAATITRLAAFKLCVVEIVYDLKAKHIWSSVLELGVLTTHSYLFSS